MIIPKNDNHNYLNIRRALVFDEEHVHYMLGITSLWLLSPVLESIAHDMTWYDTVIAISAFSVALISTCMWPGKSRETLLFHIDVFAARVLFLVLLLYYALILVYPVWFKIAMPLIILSCYCASLHYYHKNDPLADMFSHMLFRYVGYWWIYLALLRPVSSTSFAISFTLNSTLYFGHIVYSLCWTGRKEEFRLRNYYLRGCCEVVCLLVVVLIIAIVSNNLRWDFQNNIK